MRAFIYRKGVFIIWSGGRRVPLRIHRQGVSATKSILRSFRRPFIAILIYSTLSRGKGRAVDQISVVEVL